jgi:hypothetical protein
MSHGNYDPRARYPSNTGHDELVSVRYWFIIFFRVPLVESDFFRRPTQDIERIKPIVAVTLPRGLLSMSRASLVTLNSSTILRSLLYVPAPPPHVYIQPV